MMTWWFTTFMAPAIKAKVHNLPGVEYLYSVMARDQLDVPAFVTEYDMTVSGVMMMYRIFVLACRYVFEFLTFNNLPCIVPNRIIIPAC